MFQQKIIYELGVHLNKTIMSRTETRIRAVEKLC